mmetsp:Transcript_20421/g.44072  ORF Transcript_20421/g.44072 Transcript_20421/m.44072 type:complete len:337 (+) Transcript_20421:276-1286(+)
MSRPGTSSLNDDTSVHTKSLLNKTMVNSSHSNQRRNVGSIIKLRLSRSLVTQNQNLHTVTNILSGLVTNGINSCLDPLGSILQRVTSRKSSLLEPSILRLGIGSNTIHLIGIQHGRLKVNQPSSLLRHLVDTLLFTQSHGNRHDNTLTKRINGRISDLGKTLLEVVVRSMRTFRKNGNGSIISHGISSLLGRPGHILNLHTNVLQSPSKGTLSKGRGGIIVNPLLGEPHLGHFLPPLLQPLSIRMTRCNLRLDFDIVLELPRGQIDIDHLSRSKPSLLHNIRLVQIRNDTRLTHHVHGTILGNRIPRRTQPISIQTSTNTLSIGEYKQCRSVPCLQ